MFRYVTLPAFAAAAPRYGMPARDALCLRFLMLAAAAGAAIAILRYHCAAALMPDTPLF